MIHRYAFGVKLLHSDTWNDRGLVLLGRMMWADRRRD
jgi:hypothetical protein